MYRRINPTTPNELPLRMLSQPLGDGTFLRAWEADTFRSLVAAILDDPSYEASDSETRLVYRLRLADDVCLLSEVNGRQVIGVADRDGENKINIASDEPFIRSLNRLGIVSLEPGVGGS